MISRLSKNMALMSVMGFISLTFVEFGMSILEALTLTFVCLASAFWHDYFVRRSFWERLLLPISLLMGATVTVGWIEVFFPLQYARVEGYVFITMTALLIFYLWRLFVGRKITEVW